MKKIKVITIVISLIILIGFSNCSTPVASLLYTGTSQHVYSSSGNLIGSAKILKKGESCSHYIPIVNYFWYGNGGGIEKAKQESKITKIASVDRSTFNILFFYASECFVIYGE